MEQVNSADTRITTSIGRTSSKKIYSLNDIRVHRSDGRIGRIRASPLNENYIDDETFPPDITTERRRKIKERYKSLIRPSAHVSQIGNIRRQEQQGHWRQQTLLEGNPHSVQLTPKKSNMKEESVGVQATAIYRWRSPSSIDYSSPQTKHAKDIATTVTLQTTSVSTVHSDSSTSLLTPPTQIAPGRPAVVSPSSPSTLNVSRSERVDIETDVSNLTDSSSTEELDRVKKTKRFLKETMTAGDQVLASIARLQEIEQKRSIVRDQRFHLEQRLHNFRRAAKTFRTTPDDEEQTKIDLKKVVNFKYKASEHQTFLYSGYLDASGQPNDDNALLRFGDEQLYKGGVQNGMRHGSGTNQWPDGQTYSGEWQNDSRNGRGTHIWRDGRTVTGNWKNGHLHGKVYFRWPNGAVFDGTAYMGKKEGKGFTTRPDGTVYNGNYSNGKENGFGTLTRPDGSKYRGEFKNGLKEGYGVMLRSTQTYDGEWCNDRPHGQGRVVWPNGAIYTGQFRAGTYNGMGVYAWPSGKKYVGRWEKGVKHGHGIHTWPSGQVYDGAYSNGVREGYGRMSWPDGSVYCGGFQNNRRCGHGVQTDSNGAVVHCGIWKHDRPYGGPGDHEVLYVVRPHWKKAGKNSSSVQIEDTKEDSKEDQPKLYRNFSDEKLALPSLPSAVPAIVTPREGEISSCVEVGFPTFSFADEVKKKEKDADTPKNARIMPSSRDCPTRVSS